MVTKKAVDAEAGTEGDDAPVDKGAIREVVAEMLESLGITGGGGGDDTGGDDGGAGDDTHEDGKPRTQAAVEADVESKVRAEIAKLRGEEDRDRRLSALETKTAEQERSPVKERVSTRLMGWGRRSS